MLLKLFVVVAVVVVEAFIVVVIWYFSSLELPASPLLLLNKQPVLAVAVAIVLICI